MAIFFKNGFYDNSDGGFVPEGAVAISEELHSQLLQGQAEGKLIITGAKGKPQLIEPQPSPAHELVKGKWVLSQSLLAEKTQEKRTALIEHIDEVAAQIYARWNRFKTEYEEREKAALAFKEAGFTGEPSFFITSFSQSAGLDNRSAAELILRQAQGLRHLLEQLAALRMRKYELKNPELNLEQLQQLHDDIVQAMNQLAEAV